MLAEHDLAGFRGCEDVAGGMADPGQFDHLMAGRHSAGPGEPVDVFAVVEPPLEPVRALGHGRRADFEQQRTAVVILGAEDDGDIAPEIPPQALPGCALDVGRALVEAVPPSVDPRVSSVHRPRPEPVEVEVRRGVGDDEAHRDATLGQGIRRPADRSVAVDILPPPPSSR